jgi:hypothetical protein
MRYFVCTIGGFGEYSDQIKILKECLSKNKYELHCDARWPSPLGQIQKDNILLLKIQNQLVAWGVATGPVRIESPDYNGGWNRIVEVECWKQYDPQTPASGVHHYGIQWHTMPGAGQFAVVKEVDASWAEEKLAVFKNIARPLVEDIGDSTEVTCQKQSLREIFSRSSLHIPDYQRCFCWRKGNVTDLLETLRSRTSQETPDTHLGTIILKQDSDKLLIVDGQQRLLTLTILAFCMGNKVSPLLRASLNGTSNDAESARKHLFWAKTTIEEWRKTFQIKDEFIESLLNQIQFCVVTLPKNASEDLAYTFFNAVNSSGKKLSDYDLLKAHHLRFITDESIAKGMAQRWDATGAEGYDDILHKTLYRLRTWSRHSNPVVNAQDGHNLFNHFSAKASTVDGIFFPPLSIRYNSTVQGGAPFFYFAEQYHMLWQDFQKTEAYSSLAIHLSGHSGGVLRDTIDALLFLFYCKFGRSYLDDALFCIADVVSVLRNKPQVRASTIHDDVLKDCLFSLDAALDPGQFFDWCLSPERQYNPDKTGGTKYRYWEALGILYTKIMTRPIVLRNQCEQRISLLTSNLLPTPNEKEE